MREAYTTPHRTVKKHAKYSKNQGGHILHPDNAVISDSAVENFTRKMVAFENRVFDKEVTQELNYAAGSALGVFQHNSLCCNPTPPHYM